jgi:hypothetical protein
VGVPFQELDGSPTFGLSDGKFSARRELMVAWDQWPAFMAELYGGYKVVNGVAINTGPARFPGVPSAIVTGMNVVGFPEDAGQPDVGSSPLLESHLNTYPFAKFSVDYSVPFGESGNGGNGGHDDSPSVPGGYLTYTADFGMEVQPIPGRTWTYPDGLPVDADEFPGIKIPTGTIGVTWHRCQRPPWSKMKSFRGKINSVGMFGYAIERVLYLGWRESRTTQIDDQEFWTIEYQFEVKEVPSTADPGSTLGGWNRIYRKTSIDDEHWLKPHTGFVVDNNFMYATADLRELFQYPD